MITISPEQNKGKEKVSITLDRELLSILREEAEQRMMKLSNLIEFYIGKAMVVDEIQDEIKLLKQKINQLKNNK